MSEYLKFVVCIGQKCNCEDVESELVEKNGGIGKREKEIQNEEWNNGDQCLMSHTFITTWLPRFYQRGFCKTSGTLCHLKCWTLLLLYVFHSMYNTM